MNRLIPIAIAVFVISGCATSSSGPKAISSRGPGSDTEAALKQAYKDCLIRSGNDSRKCTKEKDRLLQEQEWEEMEKGS